MDQLLTNLLSLSSRFGQEAINAWHRLTEDGLLGRGCRALVASDDGGRLLEKAWSAVEDCAECCTSRLAEYYAPPAFPGRMDSQRLTANLRVWITAAGLAWAVCHARGDRELITTWARRMASVLGGQVSEPEVAATALTWLGGIEPGGLLDRLFRGLRQTARGQWQVGAAWDLCLSLLPECASRRTDFPGSKTPILLYRDADDKGTASWMHFERLADGAGESYPDPRFMSFVPMAAEFLRTAEVAWEWAKAVARTAIDCDVRWRLDRGDEAFFEGESHGTAMAVALVQLLRRQPLDAGTAISMAVRVAEDGAEHGFQFGRVTHIRKKMRAICDLKNHHGRPAIKRLLVHKQNLAEAEQAIAESSLQGAIEVRSPRDLREACEMSSGLIEKVCRYLGDLIELPDQQEAGLSEKRRASDLFIKPDLLQRVRHTRAGSGDRPEGLGEASRMPERRPEFSEMVRDVGEAPQGADADVWETDDRLPWDQVCQLAAAYPITWRGVLLGAMGAGKSFLLQMTARELAGRARDALLDQSSSLEAVELPLLVPLKHLAAAFAEPASHVATASDGDHSYQTSAVRNALASALHRACQRLDRVAAQYLAARVRERGTWLLLDGLDEVTDHAALDLLWNTLPEWECRVLVTSRPYGYHQHLGATIYEYRLAPFRQDQTFEFVGRWFQDDVAARDALLSLLAQNPAVAELGEVPYLLTLLCLVSQLGGNLASDITRTALYERAVECLLGRPRGGRHVDRERARELLDLLTEVVWQLCKEDAAAASLPRDRIEAVIAASQNRPRMAGKSDEETANVPIKQQVGALLDELSQKRFLARTPSEPPFYSAGHRSLLEYVLARALADQIAGRWRPSGCFPAVKPDEAWRCVDEHADDPHWRMVVLFLAGTLPDPSPLLERLADEQRDDVFRHRLALGAECLGEIQRQRVPTGLAEGIAGQILGRWFSAWDDAVQPMADHLKSTFSVLFQSVPGIGERLRHQLQVTKANELLGTIRAVGCDGAAAGPSVVGPLVRLLSEQESDIKREAARALASLGPLASPAIEALVALVQDENLVVAYEAGDALQRLGPAAASAVEPLVALMRHQDWWVRVRAAQILGGLRLVAGSAVESLTGLLLHDRVEDARSAAAQALGGLGPVAAPAVEALVASLQDESSMVRHAAAKALRQLGLVATSAVEPLIRFLRDGEVLERIAAAWAAYALVPAAAWAVEPLIASLQDDCDEVQVAAAYALGEGGPVAASAVKPLVDLLQRERNSWTRGAAAIALGELGPVAAPAVEPLVQSIVARLQDEAPIVRYDAVSELQSLGTGAAPAVEALIASLNDESQGVRVVAARTLGGLGPVAASAVEPLIRLLTEEDTTFRSPDPR